MLECILRRRTVLKLDELANLAFLHSVVQKYIVVRHACTLCNCICVRILFYQAELRLQIDLQGLKVSPQLADLGARGLEALCAGGHLCVQLIKLERRNEEHNNDQVFSDIQVMVG